MPDVANNQTTTASIDIDGSYLGSLETVGDRDWVRIELTSGQGVEVELEGFGFLDTYLRVYDEHGSLIALNDDINTAAGDVDSQVVFGATYSGSYYIEAASFGDAQTGPYLINTGPAVAPIVPSVDPVDTITWGTSFADNTVHVYFTPSGTNLVIDEFFDVITDDAFNAYEIGQFEAVFAQIETFTDLNFVIVTNPNLADLTIGLDTNQMTADGLLGIFNPQGETYAGNGVFNGSLWDRTAGGDLQRGGYGHVTIVHELLHGLGLSHPHDNGGTSGVMSGVVSAMDSYGYSLLNQGIFTTMSYNSGYFTGGGNNAPTNVSGGNYGFEGGPMALDIAALQAIYGTGSGYKSGGTTYSLPDQNTSGTYWTAIWDTGGRDAIVYNGTRDATIDLRMATLLDEVGGGAYASSANGIAGGFTIANSVVIEVARGGSGDDTITGNGYRNVLSGSGGNDTVDGMSGNDTINGNNGRDTLYGRSGSDSIFGQTGNDNIYGGENNDDLRGGNGDDIVNGEVGSDTLRGGNNRDQLFGGTGADVLFGEQGNDKLQGDQGADILTGGLGADLFVFVSASDSINSTVRRDVITDFTRGYDRIDLSAFDANRTRAGDQAFEFRGMRNLQDGDVGQVRIGGGPNNSVIVAVDVNADGIGDMHILVEGVGQLNASDFIL